MRRSLAPGKLRLPEYKMMPNSHRGRCLFKAVKPKKTQVEKNFIPLGLRIATVHVKSGKGEENNAELCCDIDVVPSFFMTLESS